MNHTRYIVGTYGILSWQFVCEEYLFVKSGVAHLCVSVISHIATVYLFILAVIYFHENASKFLSGEMLLQIIHLDKRKVWHGDTFARLIFTTKQRNTKLTKNTSPPKKNSIQNKAISANKYM